MQRRRIAIVQTVDTKSTLKLPVKYTRRCLKLFLKYLIIDNAWNYT
jgi:hypothetical protein